MKKLIALLTVASLSIPVAGVLAACDNKDEGDGNKTPATSIDLISGWEVNSEEDSQYTPAPQQDGSLKITYEKTGSNWQYIKHTLGYEVNDLKNMKTLVVEGSFTSTTDNPVVTYKIEYTGDIQPVEANVYMSPTNATYEWDLSNANLDKALRLLIFTAGADTTGSGELNLKKIQLVSDAINPANDYNKYTPTVTPPQHDVNTVTAENVKVGNWYELGTLNDIYTISNVEDGVKVVKNKCNGITEWASVTADVKGEYLKSLKSLKLVLAGNKDSEGLKVKVEGPDLIYAKEIKLTEGDTEIITDIVSPDKLDAEKVYQIKIFFTWDKYKKGASYTIKSAEFSTTPAPVEHVLNTITAENTSVTGWYGLVDGDYKITENADKTVKVEKIRNEQWNGVQIDVTGAALKDMKTFKIVIVGDIKQFKVECGALLNAVEITATQEQKPVNGENTIICTLKDLSDVDLSIKYNIRLFFNWDNYAEGINYTIKSAEFSTQPKA